MGQQQLLLVILVTIIVGIATVVAINIFGTAAEQANEDAIRQDLLTATTQLQGLWARPAMMGGLGGSFTNDTDVPNQQFAERSGIPGTVTGLIIDNANAEYTIVRVDANTVRINTDPTTTSAVIFAELERLASGNWEARISVDGLVNTIGGDPSS